MDPPAEAEQKVHVPQEAPSDKTFCRTYLDDGTPQIRTELLSHLRLHTCLVFMCSPVLMFCSGSLRSPKNPQQKIIKRVIGLEGDFIR